MLEQVTQYHNSGELPEGLTMQHVINEELMFRRHQRLREIPETVCEFTTDPALLHQYFLLRSIHLSKVLPTPVSPDPDEYDKRADVMVVRVGRQVVGGARILVRRSPQDMPLYIERGNWQMVDVLPELELDRHTYCELSKLFLLEEFQNSQVMQMMFACIMRRCTELGADYGFATSSPSAARIHRRTLRRIGVNYTLLSHIEVPTEGEERSDNTSYQQLIMFDDMATPSTGKLRLLKKMGIAVEMPTIETASNSDEVEPA